MPSTYTPIATTTLSSNQNSVTFSSITNIYTDLVIIMDAATTFSSSADAYQISFNGSGSNYSVVRAFGNGSSPLSDRYSTPFAGWMSTTLGNADIINIQNYANTSVFKTILTRSSSQGAYPIAGMTTVLWRDLTAISSITLTDTSGNWLAGSSFTLYGIKAA